MEQARPSTPLAKSSDGQPIDPLFNDAFIRVFGRNDSKDCTRGFVNAILREAGAAELGEIDEIDSEHTDAGEVIGCRGTRFDVLIAADDKKKLVDLEAQRQPTDIGNRALLYGARIMSTYTELGMGFSELPFVAVITLLDTDPDFEGDAIVTTGSMMWRAGDSFLEATDRLRIIVVNKKQARKRYNSLGAIGDGDELAAWLFALTNGYRRREELKQVMEAFPTIEEFARRYELAVSDPKLIRAYQAAGDYWREEESRERWLDGLKRDAIAQGLEEGREEGIRQGMKQGLEQGIKQGIEQGIEQGIGQGIEQARREGIRNLLANSGCTLEEAMDLLGIPEDERATFRG